MLAILKKHKRLAKIILSLVMLFMVLRLVSYQELKSTISTIPLSTAVFIVVGYSIGQVLSSFKWWLLLKGSNIKVSYPHTIRSYFIGMYVNFFGLGTLGGDLTRAVLVAYGTSQKAAALTSVVADRLQGLAVLALIGSISSIVFGLNSLNPYLIILLASIGPLIVLGWIVGPWFLLRFFPKENRFRSKVEEISAVFPRDKTTILSTCAISCIFHLLQIFLHWLMAIGLGVDLSFAYMLMAVPFVNILATLPISWQGLGVRENAYLFFFAPWGLTHEQAIAFGAIWLLGVTAASSIGGIVAVLAREGEELQQEELIRKEEAHINTSL